MEYYTVREIASKLEVSEEQVRRWIRSGELVGVKTSNKAGSRIADMELLRFLSSKPYLEKYLHKLAMRPEAYPRWMQMQIAINEIRECMRQINRALDAISELI